MDEKGNVVCNHLIEPIKKLYNIKEEQTKYRLAFILNDKWKIVDIDKEKLLHNGKITVLLKEDIDASTDNAALLVKYFRKIIALNEGIISEENSTSHMGWYEDKFLPFDKDIAYDGGNDYKNFYRAFHTKGNEQIWLEEMRRIRKSIEIRFLHATSVASIFMEKLGQNSFAFMLWGTTSKGKTVAAMSAMSIWGNPNKGGLFVSMNNTDNFYYRTASFFHSLPVMFDELKTYRGNINDLIMNLCEGIDRGKADKDGGIKSLEEWHNAFIFTGEFPASSYNSDGGTLNRLIEVEAGPNFLENAIDTFRIISQNYGFGAKKLLKVAKQITKKELDDFVDYFYNRLLEVNSDTGEKQARNMAILMLGDFLASTYIFNDEPLEVADAAKFMFKEEEIDVSERAYETFIDLCDMNERCFNTEFENQKSTYVGKDYWGFQNEWEIAIVRKRLQQELSKEGFNYKKTMNDWYKKGYIEKYSQAKYFINTTKGGIKASYVIIKRKKLNEENYYGKFTNN